MGRKPDVQRLTINRETAARWLSCVADVQRPVHMTTVRTYQRVMDAGDWQPFTQIIAFDRKDQLLNGQHVLKAFLESKLSKLSITVSRNHETKAYAGFDHNRKRAPSDDLRTEGIDHATQIVPVATVIWQYERQLFAGKRYLSVRGGGEFPAASEILRIVQTHPRIDHHLHKSPTRKGRYSLGAMRAASWILYQYYPEEAAKFFRSFLEGIQIPSSNHPIARLRKELLDIGPDQKSIAAGATLARIFKAWNLYAEGQVVEGSSLLKKNEEFPDIHVEVDKAPEQPPAAARKANRANVN